SAEIIYIPRHQQSERRSVAQVTQIKCQRMHIREPVVRRRRKSTRELVIASAQLIEHIVPFAVPCAHGQTCAGRCHNAPRSKWWIIKEPLIWIDLCAVRVTHRHEPQLIDIVDLCHRLDETLA